MSFARAGYTAFVWFAAPFAALYLLWRSRRQPQYRAHWGERFGWARYAPTRGRPLLWLHAVSVGETRAAEPLIAALLERYPQHDLLLTHMTPTGRETGGAYVAQWPGRITQVYLPYDLPFAVRRFLRAFRPVVGIGMETETWPNLLALAREEGVPMVLVNARLSEKSLAKAQRTPNLVREAAGNFALVLAQTAADAGRMRRVGAGRVEVVGNLKFDFTPSLELVEQGRRLRAALGARPVLLFASTREGEEALILDALQASALARSRGRGAASSAALRRRCAPAVRARPALRAAFGPRLRASGVRHRFRAGRFDGGDGAVLRRGRRGADRGQPAAAGRTEPDRGVRGGHPCRGRAAHIQFRAGDR